MGIQQNLAAVSSAIQLACSDAQRAYDEVTLLAVSKRHSAENIRLAYALSQRDFGENYLNEALEKQPELTDLDICWHFIGHIQSNKTRKIAENFQWAHAVDSLKIAKRLSDQRPADMPPLNICIQVNIDGEESKAGVLPDFDKLSALSKEIEQLPYVNLRGLMCIPAPKETKEEERKTFNYMNELLSELKQQDVSVDTLSMGMSGDLDSAIHSGATMVRVGTAIFGTRA